jgi:hypothetical protein
MAIHGRLGRSCLNNFQNNATGVKSDSLRLGFFAYSSLSFDEKETRTTAVAVHVLSSLQHRRRYQRSVRPCLRLAQYDAADLPIDLDLAFHFERTRTYIHGHRKPILNQGFFGSGDRCVHRDRGCFLLV